MAHPRSPGRSGLRILLAALLAFIALNAWGGGLYGMLGAKAIPAAWLAGTPFRSYFLPGLFLFAVVGGTWAAASLLVFRRDRRARAAAAAAGLLGLAWIAVQVAMIGYVSPLQPAVAGVSAAVLLLARRAPSG